MVPVPSSGDKIGLGWGGRLPPGASATLAKKRSAGCNEGGWHRLNTWKIPILCSFSRAFQRCRPRHQQLRGSWGRGPGPLTYLAVLALSHPRSQEAGPRLEAILGRFLRDRVRWKALDETDPTPGGRAPLPPLDRRHPARTPLTLVKTPK